MDKKIGFIGSGNMAEAMIKGLISSSLISPERVIVSARTRERLDFMEGEYGVKTTLDNKELVRNSDYIILAIKPNIHGLILEEIKGLVRKDSIVITIGAGISLDYLRRYLGPDIGLVKAMPNTPSMVGEGITGLAFDTPMDEEIMNEIQSIFNSFGRSEILDEDLMDGFTALCGSSPAYIYMLIEAMADGGVMEGIARDQAYRMAAQAVLGSAKMVLESGLHPGELKDKVCSPKGTTIEAVAKLEELGFRSSIIEAMRVCGEKSKKMGR